MKKQMKRVLASILAVAMLMSSAASVPVWADSSSTGEFAANEDIAEVKSTSEGETSHVSADDLADEDIELADISSDEVLVSSDEVSAEDIPEDFLVGDSDQAEDDVILYSSLIETETTDNTIILQSKEDFVSLSQQNAENYKDKTIEIAPHEGKPIDLSESEFQGFGSSTAPFAGKIGFSGTYTGYILTDKALFNFLSQDADVGTLNLEAKADTDTQEPLLTELYVKGDSDEPGSISLNLSAGHSGSEEDGNLRYSTFGGVIGTMGESSELSLSVNFDIPAGYNKVSGEGNRGLLCNTMENDSALMLDAFTQTVENTGNFSVTSTNADAGALVGHMDSGASLSLVSDLTVTVEVSGYNNAGGLVGTSDSGAQIKIDTGYHLVDTSIISSNGNAGGLVGSGVDTTILHLKNASVDIQMETLQANSFSGAAGGLVGTYTVENKQSENVSDVYETILNSNLLELNTVNISDVSITGGFLAGGLFGKLVSKVINDTFSIQKSIESNYVSSEYSLDKADQTYGGLIGLYKAEYSEAALQIDGCTAITRCYSQNPKAYGGLIGEISGKAYIEAEHVSVQVTLDTTPKYYGGVVGLAGTNTFLNLGDFTATATDGFKASEASGGLVGEVMSGVIRLHGTTDLTSSKTSNTKRNTGQLIGHRKDTLVYALGNGETEDDLENEIQHWCLKRSAPVSASDLGDWGEVIRLDGTNLKEKVLDGTNDENSQALFTFDMAEHKVSISGFEQADGMISSTQEFLAYALCYQLPGCIMLSREKDVLYTSEIMLKSDIDLTGTGLTGFTRDGSLEALSDDMQNLCRFDGKFQGDISDEQMRKITLAAGEPYGLRNDKPLSDPQEGETVAEGSGQLYDHCYLGLFGQRSADSNECVIANLELDGKIRFCLTAENDSNPVYAGAVSGYQPCNGRQTYENVNVKTSLIYNSMSGNKIPTAYVGGFTGFLNYGAQVEVNDSFFEGKILNTATSEMFFNGGLFGFLENNNDDSSATITVRNTKLGGTLSTTVNTSESRVGGLLASTATPVVNNAAKVPSKTNMTISNLKIDTLTVSTGAKEQSGGFLGYEWRNVDLDVTGLSIQNSSLQAGQNGMACFGGLVNKASGIWNVRENNNVSESGYTSAGIQYAQGVKISGCTTKDNPSALLVARGDNYVYAENPSQNGEYKLALYMNLESAGAYRITEQPKITFTDNSGAYFDEIVGRTIMERNYKVNGISSLATPDHNGIVSIATEDNALINQNGHNTYVKQLATDYNNPHTRYYYNLEALREKSVGENSESTVWADDTVESGEELLLWSVGQYCEENLFPLFSKSRRSPVKLTGDINLKGLSYYPIDFSRSVEINDADIFFDYDQIEQMENDSTENKRLNNSEKQHYRMQDGLFYTLTSTKSNGVDLKITGDGGVTLEGTIGQLTETDYEGGSGVLVCGQANGETDGTTIYNFTFASTKIVLNDLYIYDEDGLGDYAPLLINRIGSFSSVTVEHVSQKYEPNEDITQIQAATSLIGKVGSETATNIMLYFSDMDLSGVSDKSIFTRATLLESFYYSDPASSGAYNFNKNEAAITYGREISNGIGLLKGRGRNPYEADQGTGQVWYYDTFGETEDKDYVTNEMDKSVDGGFASDKYLRYVAVPEQGTDGAVTTAHELDINQLVVDITEGCGTYDDPYIIDSNGQLETLAKCLSNKGQIVGWHIQFCTQIAKSKGTESLSTHKDQHERFTSGNAKWTGEGETGSELTSDQALAYLRNAYYMIRPKNDDYTITLGSSFYGLGGFDPGSDQSESNVFSGVIVGAANETTGAYPTLKVSDHENKTAYYFGGLIAYSGGSVVKNLNLDYSDSQICVLPKGPSQNRWDQAFFGGVIGYVVGGDNIIDNVKVQYERFSLSVIDNNYAHLTDVGGYVGLIGGNTSEGGGVIFRNLDGQSNLNGSDYQEDSDYYYRNAYVGRVLDGYAFSESCELQNTDKNYTIPQINWTGMDVPSVDCSNNTVTISSAQQLWILSAIVNSGAAGMYVDSGNYYYNSDAYRRGRVRTGKYEQVGVEASVEERSDDQYWGGISYDETETGRTKYAYLVTKCLYDPGSDNLMAYLTGKGKKFNLEMSGILNMEPFGNGFRGIGTTYQDNNSNLIQDRTMHLNTSIGGSNEKPATVIMNRKIKEYTGEYNKDGNSSGWWAQGIGLFPALNIQATSKTIIQYLTIEGEASVSYSGSNKDNYIGEASAGALAGMTANNSTKKDVELKAVHVNNMTVKGAKYAGGFFGVIGKSSRISGSTFSDVSTDVGNYSLNSCGYDILAVEGAYSAGGVVGTYCNSGKNMNVSGTTIFKESSIEWKKDSCKELFDATKDSTKSKKKGYSGCGGLIGYFNGNEVKINQTDSEADKLEIMNVKLFAPQFAFNTDYGVAGLVGSVTDLGTGTLKVNNVSFSSTKVAIRVSDKFVGAHGKDQDTKKYYTTPAMGLVSGYDYGTATITHLAVDDCQVINGGWAGGLIGCHQKDISVTDVTISNLLMYSRGAGSYGGVCKNGALVGVSVGRITNVDTIKMENVKVVTDGASSLIMGLLRGSATLNVKNLSVKGCVAATMQEPTYNKCYLAGATDPNNSPRGDFQTDYTAGCAGILVGASQGSDGDAPGGLSILRAFNICVTDSIVGYYPNGAQLSYNYNQMKPVVGSAEATEDAVFDENTIGVYTGTNTGNPYSEVKIFDSDRYITGYLGLLIGAQGTSTADNKGYMQVVALSVDGGYYPYELNGNGDVNFTRKSVNADKDLIVEGDSRNSSYCIFADYLTDSAKDNVNKEGTMGGMSSSGYLTQNDPVNPYVMVNPSSGLVVYLSQDSTQGLRLTGNGMNDVVKDAIVTDQKRGNEAPNKSFVTQYNRVKYLQEEGDLLSDLAQKFDKNTGEYKDRLTTFSAASESDLSKMEGLMDFNVLMIDTTNSRVITQMIREYISVLTNCDQTGQDVQNDAAQEKTKARYQALNAYTYQWNESSKKFVKTTTPSLIIKPDSEGVGYTIAVATGAHDNQNNQFTIIDAYYKNPNLESEGYHLFIPVVVKKVLETSFSLKMLNGSSAYAQPYNTTDAILASYGENFTMQLTYSYSWTAAEWNDNIAAGTNFLWSYDKQVELGKNKADLCKNTTRYTLVDMNRHGQGNTYFVGTGQNLVTDMTAATLRYNDLEGFHSVYLSDLMNLTVTQDDENGFMKKVGTGGSTDTVPSGATIRCWNGVSFDYYGLKTGGDAEGTTYYTVKVKGEPNENVTFSEVYYLTVNCKEGSGVVTQDATLGLSKMSSLDPLALPSKMQKTPERRQYTLGDFYELQGVTLTAEGENKTDLMEVNTNDYIDVSVETMVNVPENYQKEFSAYGSQDDAFLRFALQMHKDGTSGSELIDASNVTAQTVKLGSTELSSDDYQIEVSNGICYLLIKKKGGDFLNTKVNATIRLSYEGDATRIAAQFPLRSSLDDTNSGIYFSVDAVIAYSQDSLDGSRMSSRVTNMRKFYRNEISVAKLSYNSYGRTSLDGNTSQLGINGREVARIGGIAGGDTITSLGMYDATSVAGLDFSDKNGERYPARLACRLSLAKKNDQGKYESVFIKNYFDPDSIKVTSASKSVKGWVNSDGDYEFTIELTDQQVQDIPSKQIEMDLSYFVYSDTDLEKIGVEGQYANYRVTLSACLTNSNGITLVDQISDYLIYTNAKFYLGILSYSDFDD